MSFALAVYLLIYGTYSLFLLFYILTTFLMITRAILINGRKRLKLALILTYLIFLVVQIYFVIVSNDEIIHRAIKTSMLYVPFVFEKMFTMSIHTKLYLPSIEDVNTITPASVRNLVSDKIDQTKKLSKALHISNVAEVAVDLNRHSSIKYINEGFLTNEYFEAARSSLDDPYIYIVISNTGSSASEILSVFTKKQFNHASISFDKDLKTTISYNGGHNVYPPGLNQEFISFFNKKDDASIITYRLECTVEQKQKMIDKVYAINEEGSAYNILGLVLKNSYKPNIMFCSQFVYSMLKYVELDYFHEKAELVKPSDLIELDYYRRLEFVEEIKFV